MSRRQFGARLLSIAAALGLAAAVTGLSVPGARAAGTTAAVTCPTVNPGTGVVTPGWANGVDWAGCDLAGASLEDAELASADLAGANLTGADLQGADVSYSDLTGVNLTGAVLGAANVSSTLLAGATLTNATSGGLTGTPASLPADWIVSGGFLAGPGADLSFANLYTVDLTGADLTGANLANASLTQTTLTGAILAGATLTGVASNGVIGAPASLPADWSITDGYLLGPGANLTSAVLASANLTGQDLSGANLTYADFNGSNLTGANLTDTILTGPKLGGATLTRATLTGVQSAGISGIPAALPANWTLLSGFLFGPGTNLEGADLNDFSLAGFDLAGANLASSQLLDANLTSTDAADADLSNSLLNNATLSSADLAGANLTDAGVNTASLAGANLADADLTEAGVSGTYLAGADLAGATLTGIGSSGDTGTPSHLPAGWIYQGGYFIGPGASLTDATLTGFDLAGADLTDAGLVGATAEHVTLTSANLTDADLASAHVAFTDFTGANLTDADLTSTDLSDDNLTNANLDGATSTDATFAGVVWDNTTCPDGSNSNDHVAGCFSAVGVAAPVAAPVVSGTAGAAGWYTSEVTVSWHWSDPAGTINTAACAKTSTSAGEGTLTLSATCSDESGNVGKATYQVTVDTTRPQVTVTGVKAGASYALGTVPAAGCSTAEAVSGVAAEAALTAAPATGVTGRTTATCAGAVSTAGLAQAAPVSATFGILHGSDGFAAPLAGSTVARSAHTLTVRFRLADAAGNVLTGAAARKLGTRHDLRVSLTGPAIKAVTAFCEWVSARAYFQCGVAIPAKVKTGKSRNYTLTAQEDLGWGFVAVPAYGKTAGHETIHFS